MWAIRAALGMTSVITLFLVFKQVCILFSVKEENEILVMQPFKKWNSLTLVELN